MPSDYILAKPSFETHKSCDHKSDYQPAFPTNYFIKIVELWNYGNMEN